MQGITITLTADDKLTALLERFIIALEQPKSANGTTQINSVGDMVVHSKHINTLNLESPKADEPAMMSAEERQRQEAYESLMESAHELEKAEAEKKEAKRKALTITEVRKAIMDAGLGRDQNALALLLSKFGAKKLSDVKKEDYPALIDNLKEMTS